MTRIDAIARARQVLTSGDFLAELGRRVAYRTESLNPDRKAELAAYLTDELTPSFTALGFTSELVPSPSGRAPFLIATYHESDSAPTVLSYGHGDTVDGMADEWRDGRDPWAVTPAEIGRAHV